MNNNNFAMMRYFRDLGTDAHLLLYSNDGRGTLSHFTPEADTWELDRWAPFIHQTVIPNAPVAAFDFPLSTAVGVRSALRRLTGAQDSAVGAVTRAQLRRAYGGYDRLIGSGSTPAALLRIGRALDVFYPYSPGVEFLGSSWFTVGFRSSWQRRFLYGAVRRQQMLGLSHARVVVCTDRETTGAVLAEFGVPSFQQTIPMVYNRERSPADAPTASLAKAHVALREAGLTMLHHARLMWQQRGSCAGEEHLHSTKNSDWLIRAFAALVAARPSVCPRLFIVEYGPDVEATKELVAQLGIQNAVTWLPKMARRELMWLLGRVSVGVGEFMNPRCMIWGGTGWETLASGKPLLQGFRFEEGEFADFYGYPPPPMLPVKAESDVLEHLLFVADHPEQAAEIGRRARGWFDTYNGIALAKKWLALVTDPPGSAQPATPTPC
ncbi:MAG: glycosyltransferase family 4 protein [Verrucomicrobia bacterium]|nr:glycosyltransferase family 4 protein [Verrucomicrobiota bacterium]